MMKIFGWMLFLIFNNSFSYQVLMQGREEKFRNTGFAFGLIWGLETGSMQPQVLPSYAIGGMSVELMKNSISVGIGFIGLTEKLQSAFILSGDTIPSKTKIGILYYPIYVGYIWDLSDKMGIFPHFGLDFNTSYLHDDEKFRLGIDPDFNSYSTIKIGVGVFYHLNKRFSSYRYLNGSSMMARLDFGISQSPRTNNNFPNRDRFIFANIHFNLFNTHAKD
jgi:hypothetical protein